MRKYYLTTNAFLILLIATLWVGCGSESTDQSEDTPTAEAEMPEEATAKFVANPQFIEKQEVSTLELGAKAPDFNLIGVDGEYHTLDEYDDAEVLVIVFTCNHCPTAQAYEERVMQVVEDYSNQSVQVIAISPNSPLGLMYSELGYTDLDDDYDAMILRAEHMDFNFPYLYDGDNEAASLKYGPVATPHAFVFDADRTLQYQGRLDKVEKPGTLNADDLRAAVDAVLAGETPETQTTKVFGCSTKWGWKTEYKDKANADWAAREVTLEKADVAGIKQIMKNEDSGKLRLINVWATWCGPCIVEYPDFIVLQRMYGARDFEFVSISADKPEEFDKALRFLEEKESGVANYLFSEDDKYALIEAVDSEWNGALPYTALIEPGGKIVWSHQGQIDFLELKRAIVDHPMIGRYY